MKTQSSIHLAFWIDHPQFQHFFRRARRQNDYPADVRTAFVDFVDNLARDGRITEKLAGTVTL